MKIWTVAIVALLGLLAAPPSALGWGDDGHKIVADIAWHEMTPQARSAVEALLRDDPKCKSIVDASTWADQVRRRPEYAWSASLHYVNLPDGATEFDVQRDCKDGNCVVGAIERFKAVLAKKGATVDERRDALKFLVHFVGDIHQPLHVSRARDRGGNDIKVEFFHDRTNLHKVWDLLILRHAKKSWTDYAEQLRKRITKEQRDEWAGGTPSQWAMESYRLAIDHAYAIPKDGVLGEGYYDRNIPIVEQQLTRAGLRLAIVLNDLFGSDAGSEASAQ